MQNSEVKALIEAGLPDAEVQVSGEGCDFQALVVSPAFEGKLPVARQKMVYATLGDLITSGALHAVTIKAYTPEQWAQMDSSATGSA